MIFTRPGLYPSSDPGIRGKAGPSCIFHTAFTIPAINWFLKRNDVNDTMRKRRAREKLDKITIL